MSGTAGLSAAKNRRSGNEVKFNGQSKSIPPPEQTSMTGQPLMRQTSAMPNPMEILKSHEFRLQQLEEENMEQDFLNHKVDFLTLKTDFLTLKNELLTNNKIVNASKVEVATCNNTKSTNSAEVTALQQRVGELNTIVANLTKEIVSIKQYIREKVEPGLTKILLQPPPLTIPFPLTAPVSVPSSVPVSVPASAPVSVSVPVSVPASAPVPVSVPSSVHSSALHILPLQEIHLNIPFIEPELVNIQLLPESKSEPVFDNILLSIGC